jgi:hypothetical protein
MLKNNDVSLPKPGVLPVEHHTLLLCMYSKTTFPVFLKGSNEYVAAKVVRGSSAVMNKQHEGYEVVPYFEWFYQKGSKIDKYF